MPKNPSLISGKRRYSKYYYSSSIYNGSSDSSDDSKSSDNSYSSNSSYSSSNSYYSSNSNSNSSNSSDEELIDADGFSDNDSVASSDYISGFSSNNDSDDNDNNLLNARIAASRGGKYNSVFGKGPYRAKSLPRKSIQKLYSKKKHHHHHHHHRHHSKKHNKEHNNESNDNQGNALEENIILDEGNVHNQDTVTKDKSIKDKNSLESVNEPNQNSLNITDGDSGEMSLKRRYSAVKKTFSRKSRKNLQSYRSKSIGKTVARGKYIQPSDYRRGSFSSSSSFSDSDIEKNYSSNSDFDNNNNDNDNDNNENNDVSNSNNENYNNAILDQKLINEPFSDNIDKISNTDKYEFINNTVNNNVNNQEIISEKLYCICKQKVEDQSNMIKCNFCSGKALNSIYICIFNVLYLFIIIIYKIQILYIMYLNSILYT